MLTHSANCIRRIPCIPQSVTHNVDALTENCGNSLLIFHSNRNHARAQPSVAIGVRSLSPRLHLRAHLHASHLCDFITSSLIFSIIGTTAWHLALVKDARIMTPHHDEYSPVMPVIDPRRHRRRERDDSPARHGDPRIRSRNFANNCEARGAELDTHRDETIYSAANCTLPIFAIILRISGK